MAALLKKRALAEYNKTFQDAPPTKKLHLVKKPLIGSSAAAFVGLLEKSKSSDDAMQLLLRISDCLQFEESDIDEAIKKLSDHFQSEEEAIVRVKILWLFCDIGLECPGANLNYLIDETTQLIKNETSHKVISQAIGTLQKLGSKLSDDKILALRLVNVAKENLKDTSDKVKCRCLELIGDLYPIVPESDRTLETIAEADSIIKLLGDYTNADDPRVRSESFRALLALQERGQPLGAALYDCAAAALADDFEIVREVALKIVWLLGNKYPENTVTMSDGETAMRLVDDAFMRICSAVNDLSVAVRALACSLLGGMRLVSDRYLLQTLDKQLMSNMKKKQSLHERSARRGFARGRRWAADAPGELLPREDVSLLPGGAAGAVVHGLEDEFLEVRTAAVDAVCALSLGRASFAAASLDFLVDMFNDEIEEVRLRAIDSLTRIAHHIVLREDQLETILSALEDYSMDVREGLHRLLGACSVASTTCLEMCVDKILENLKRYPQDKRSTYRCAQRLGAAHAALALPLASKLLSAHPFFDMPEPDVEDPSYVCVLILVLNAAANCGMLQSLLEGHARKHLEYLRDTVPHLVPQLPLDGAGGGAERERGAAGGAAGGQAAVQRFFDTVLQHVDNGALSLRSRLAMLASAEEQLNKLCEMEPSVSGAASLAALCARVALALHCANLASPHTLRQLHVNCLRLQHQFSGVSPQESALIGMLCLRADAARLAGAAAAAAGGAGGAAGGEGGAVAEGGGDVAEAAAALTLQAEALDRLLAAAGVEPDAFTIAVFQQMALAGERPAELARAVGPLLRAAALPAIPRPNLKIRMCTATIVEPARDNDTVLRFCAGLVAGVALEAEVLRVREPAALRVRVVYPDQRSALLHPPPADLRTLDHMNTNDDGTQNVRLLTKVLVSHGVWSEPCGVDIAVCLAVPGGHVELCRPVTVTVAPKPIKRGI